MTIYIVTVVIKCYIILSMNRAEGGYDVVISFRPGGDLGLVGKSRTHIFAR